MTTTGNLVVKHARRLRAHWPALVLPAVAAEMVAMFRYRDETLWITLLALSVLLVAAWPALAARLAPLVLSGYGFLGLMVAHALLNWQDSRVWYGFELAQSAQGSLLWVLPEAFCFLAASIWLLVVTGGPGQAAVRTAVRQLLGVGGEPRTIPALLLLPVIFLWEETFANPLWYGPGLWRTVGFLLPVGGVVLMMLRPRIAVMAAVAGLLGAGLVLLFGFYDSEAVAGFLYLANTKPDWAYFSPGQLGALSGLGGPVALLNYTTLWLIRAEGIALIAVGCALAPRLLGWQENAELVRRATALTRRVDRLTRTRSDATDTAVAELRRIERDLHDGAQARLVAVGMSLRAAEQLIRANPDAAVALVAEARETSSRALNDLRDLVRGIYPPVLADRGLSDAVRALALDAPLPVAAAVYFGVAEALTNAVRHAESDTVQVSVDYRAGMVRATVADGGVGGADPARGTGLAGVERRLATFDGILAVSSPPGGPTIVVLEVPCALASAHKGSAPRASGPAWQVIG